MSALRLFPNYRGARGADMSASSMGAGGGWVFLQLLSLPALLPLDFWLPESPQKLPRSFQKPPKAPNDTSDAQRSFWGLLEASGGFWGLLGPLGTSGGFWGLLGVSGDFWGLLGASGGSGVFWGLLGASPRKSLQTQNIVAYTSQKMCS